MDVDVEGTLMTLASGKRALSDVTVYAYTDKAGKILIHGPLIKGLLGSNPVAVESQADGNLDILQDCVICLHDQSCLTLIRRA